MFRKSEGFTLVELMVVVLIVGILVAVAIPAFILTRARAEMRACHANQRTLEGAFQSYYGATLTTSTDIAGDYVPDFMKEIPYCPDEGSSSSEAAGGYTLGADGAVANCVDAGGADLHGHY